MSPVYASRRRAEAFDVALEDALAGREFSSRFADDLSTVAALRSITPVEPRADFVAGLRGRLMAEAEEALTSVGPARAVPATPARPPRRERRLAVAVSGLALVGATTSVAVASQSALPGEPLYPIKRAIENAQTGVQGDSDSKGATLLSNASGRLDEVDELSRADAQSDPVVISSTLDSFSEQATEASELLLDAYAETGRPELVEEVRAFASTSMDSLRNLEPLVPPESRVALIEASQVLRQIEQVAQRVCPSCAVASIDQTPLVASTSYEELITDLVEDPLPPAKTIQKKPKRQKKTKTPTPGPEQEEGSQPSPPVPSAEATPKQPPKPKSEPSKPRSPVKDLTDQLLNGGNTSGPKVKNPVKDATKGVQDATKSVEDTVKGVTDGLRP